ncbi:hypothetical protein GCM10023193_19400 [Planotetraspora kaengkrachanensis]|uniref:Uncharacterized protein n=1 Tax=Planotetraspora kaengkrachanensis TaxID=575193 RepID=A0A8J3V7D7_9ACTN|nr:hypothetical protein Pka01_46930 [Planotetraspora kaengkrachanensis]
MEVLASAVRNELAAAGLPVLAPGLDSVLAAGAEVNIDDGADAAGGVFVGSQANPRLRCRLRRPLVTVCRDEASVALIPANCLRAPRRRRMRNFSPAGSAAGDSGSP